MASKQMCWTMVVAGLAMPAAAALARIPAAPRLAVKLLDGNAFDLSAERGHVVVVNVWATWCLPCRAEMPVLDRYARAHPDVTVIGVSMDQRRDAGKVRQIMAPMGYRSTMFAMGGVDDFADQRELPVTYVIDRKGHLAARIAAGHPVLTDQTLGAAVATVD